MENGREITFPYHGSFVSKRGGHVWRYVVHEDGQVDVMERYENAPVVRRSTSDRRCNVVCGGSRIVSVTSKASVECLKAIEKAIGKKTDGWQWVDAFEDAKDMPVDGSYRMMEKTNFIMRNLERNVERVVYRHKPTDTLWYVSNDTWFRTYVDYCYDRKTGEKGKYFGYGI